MNFANLNGWEWVIILVIVLLLFGVGRISKIAGELGNSIKSFREGMKSEEDKNKSESETSEKESESKTKDTNEDS